MDEVTRKAVAERANFRCEYCGIAEFDDTFAFHVEHIIAAKHGGTSSLDNLAFACQHCNLHKGSNLSGIDPVGGEITPLFNPRLQLWVDHFTADQFVISGLTPTGRATVRVLCMNDADRVQLRAIVGQSA